MDDRFSQIVRLMWIDAVLDEEGEIGRADIRRAFGISTPQASLDLSRYMKDHPGRMYYDRSLKRYLTIEGSRPKYRRSARIAAVDIVEAIRVASAAKDAAGAAQAAGLVGSEGGAM